MVHHNTIRKYTAALLDLFNNIEIQYMNSSGDTLSKNVPITYISKEKSLMLDQHTSEQLLQGNYNVLPRANISLSTMVKADQRVQNKNLKINKVKSEDEYSYSYNSIPYEFTFELSVICRGMNEAAIIIEQIAPKFNPTVNVDIWDAENLNEPTRIPLRLLDVGIEQPEYDELSTNLVTVSFGLSLMGNLYQPIKNIERIKEFKILLNEVNGDYYTRKAIMGWDVDTQTGDLDNETIINLENVALYPPSIISITGDNISLGDNTLTAIWEDYDNDISEISFEWAILEGDAVIVGNETTATLTINDYGAVEIQCTITDVYNNYSSYSKIFYVAASLG